MYFVRTERSRSHGAPWERIPLRAVGPYLVLTGILLAISVPAQDDKPDNILSIKAPPIERPLYIVTMDAPAVGREMKYMVLLPEGYWESEERYPVLYLLHGFSQNYTVWPRMGVPEYTAGLDLIVVMPDAGNSWYINWAKSAEGQKNDWETYIVHDLIEHVDETFRTIPRREGRAINGLSMGGYGALTLALRHPGLFCAAGSHSGALTYAANAREKLEAGGEPEERAAPPQIDDPRDASVPDAIAIDGFTRQGERYPLGAPFLKPEDAAAYDPFVLVVGIPPASLPHIYIDCGLQDSLFGETMQFMELLLANGLEFTFGQSVGEHRPSYWTRAVAHSIGVQYGVIQRSLRQAEAKKQREAQSASTPPE